jgi:Fe-S oxidoreductase
MSTATLARGLNALREVIDAPIASYFNSCVHCGMCADACLFYIENGKPEYTPINKVEPMRRLWEQEYTLLGRLKKLIGLSKPVTDEELAEWRYYVYDSCTLCGRCTMVCPVGNDIVYMIRKFREGMSASGHAPEGIASAASRAVKIGSPMGVTLKAVKAQAKHVEDSTGLSIPFDVKGAEFMVLLSSMEIMNFPEYLGAIARIMEHAGKTWTLSSEAFEATNSGIQIGASDIARVLVKRVVDAAEKLQVKTVISPECGHAYTAIRWEGPNLMGRPFGFRVRHILEVLDEFRAEHLLQLEGKEEQRITFHDPCQLVRRGGVVEEPRRLMHMFVGNLVEMEDAGRMNWCCGAGGGQGAIEEAHEQRMNAFRIKKRQIENTGAEVLMTACANCRIQLEEGLEEYNVELPVIGLTEALAEHLVEKKKG